MNNNGEIGNCLNCNKEFIKKKQVKDHKFCCKNCKTDYYKKNPKMETVICSNCNKEYTRRKQSRYNNNYCSLDCEKEFKHNEKWEFRKCEICNEDFECKKISTQKFCSTECQGKWQSITLVGVNANNYNINISEEDRTKVCEWCGKTYRVKQACTHETARFCSDICRQTWYAKEWSQSEAWREKQRINAVKLCESGILSNRKTGIQQIVDDNLDLLQITYENEQGFVYSVVDNYLPDNNLVIEVMGEFWHCDHRRYNNNIEYKIQVNRIRMDKIKHTYIKNNYNIEILYLWESDINNNIEMVNKLIKLYNDNKGILSNYHSFNYYLNNNNELSLVENIVIPYMNWEVDDLNKIIDIRVKESMSKKQQDKWITFNCECCGTEKEELISHYNKKAHHYCSRKCYNQLQQNRTEVKCECCNILFQIKLSLYDKNKNKRFFCTQKCQHIYQKTIGFKQGGDTKIFNCDNCGKEATQKNSDYNKSKHHFCSKECNYIFKKKK